MPSLRRAFLKALAATPLLPASLAAATPAGTTGTTPPSPLPSPPAEVADPRVEALAKLVEVRHGQHLQPGDIEAVKAKLTEAQSSLGRLNAVRLGNADEPVDIFAAAAPRRS